MKGFIHITVGLTLSILVFLIFGERELSLFIISIIFGVIGSKLPDKIDPAGHFAHRSLGHNFFSLFLSLAISVFLLFLLIFFENSFLVVALLCFFISFFSHLILDMMTPMGLPLFVGRKFLTFTLPLYAIPILNFIFFLYSLDAFLKFVKKNGGRFTLFLLLFPLWGLTLFFGIIVLDDYTFLSRIFFIITIIILILIIKIGDILDKEIN